MRDKHKLPLITSVVAEAQAAQASRRRRLWELGHACHCPLAGVGLQAHRQALRLHRQSQHLQSRAACRKPAWKPREARV